MRSMARIRRPTRLRAMSLSFTFALLLVSGVAALGLVLLIMLIQLRALGSQPFRRLSRCRSSFQRTFIRV